MFYRLVIGIALCLGAASAWADEPWKSKSYKEWTEKDVQRILSDSPWTKRIHITASWRRTQAGSSEQATGRRSSRARSSDVGVTTRAGAEPTADDSSTSSPDQRPEAVFYMRWASAQTVREAIVRSETLRAPGKEAAAEKFIAQQPTEYIVVVHGPDMMPFAQMDEATLKAKTYLRPRRTKIKIAPLRSEVERSAGARRITAVTFYFPKQLENGEAVIASDEKGVEFVCEIKDAKIQANFDVQKMVGKQGPDF